MVYLLVIKMINCLPEDAHSHQSPVTVGLNVKDVAFNSLFKQGNTTSLVQLFNYI